MDEGSSCVASVGVSCLNALAKAMSLLDYRLHTRSQFLALQSNSGGVSSVRVLI